MAGHPMEPSYSAALNDKYVQTNVDCVAKYLLGQHNQARRIRDVYGVLLKYVDLGVTCWSYWALLLKLLLLAFNTTAIFYAFLTYKSPTVQEWRFSMPTRIVVWAEFIGICCYLLWFLWNLARWLWALTRELCSARDDVYARNLQTCTALRGLYSASMKLEFNLLQFLRYVSPPAVMAALARARRRVYARYGTRVHREGCCLDLCCCCCFYGRLCLCSLFQSLLVLGCMAVALMAVFLKVLQLRFLGTADIATWSVTEILLFGQFVINMIFLDTREQSKRKAKLQFLFFGADTEKAAGERDALDLVENLALLVLRYRYNLLTALVLHHSITSDDISYLYIQDDLEEDKPRNAVRHEYKKSRSVSSNGDAGSDFELGAPPPGPYGADSSAGAGAPPGGYYAADPHARPRPQAMPMRPSTFTAPQVVVQMSPSRAGGNSGSRHNPDPDADCFSMPPPPMMQAMHLGMQGPSVGRLAVAADHSKRFPYDFYSQGVAVGAPLRGSSFGRPPPPSAPPAPYGYGIRA